ncbi:MAG: ABC transporter ATP-binding protein [Halanaerobium sp.]|nr:ABC transporter ATP-binding protein [Halanaerobium sp.]
MEEKPILVMQNITKRFPGVLANDDVTFNLREGEIHALLGENGAGKTTLMNILYGLYQPDAGSIFIKGEEKTITSPRRAIELGIGMVHQHFALIEPHTVLENIVLGQNESWKPGLDMKSARKKLEAMVEEYGLSIDPDAKVWQLSVGEKQRVEIIKALYRDVRILILDEPTSVLTEQEADDLFDILKMMTAKGLSIIFISHKLKEVTQASDRVTVLRKGHVEATVETKGMSKDELARLMVGRNVLFDFEQEQVEQGVPVLEVTEISARNDKGLPALRHLTLEVREGEILGIAGVAGNGQKELAGVIAGLKEIEAGKITLDGTDISNYSPKKRMKAGVGFVPEDRNETGLMKGFPVKDNLILRSFNEKQFCSRGFLRHGQIVSYCRKLVEEYDIKTPSLETRTSTLSGGNLQKVILARELSGELKFLLAAQPTQGLDVGAAEFVRQKLLEQRQRGVGVLLISEDLDEILQISDRVAVIYEGQIMGCLTIQEAKEARSKLGLMMTGSRLEEIAQVEERI